MEKKNSATTTHENVYKMVTSKIMDALIKGNIPWRQTWTAKKGEKHPFTNYVTGKPYSFINTLLLGEPGEYATFNQIKERGGHLKKGSHSKMVIYWGEFIPKENKEKAEELEAEGKSIDHLKVRFPKYYLVFNVKDAEGLKDKNTDEDAADKMQEAESSTLLADMVLADYKINEQVKVVSSPSATPGYDASEDIVSVPDKECFCYEEDWWAEVFDGLVHSTAKKGRCDRDAEFDKMLSGNMSPKEELIAEIGSSMILTACGLKKQETHTQIAAECERFMEMLNKDYRLIVSASYGAEKAAKLILGEYAA